MPKRIYVGNLPAATTKGDVEKLFAPYGKVAKVQIEGSGRSLVAYVDMVSDSEASSAIKGLANVKMGAVTLNVNEARP